MTFIYNAILQPRMEKIITADGSVTFHNDVVGDHYHSKTIGAFEEAMEKYARPVMIKEGMTILDVCFGLGYNTLAAMALAKKLHIIGLEADSSILEKIEEIPSPNGYDALFAIIRKAAKEHHYIDESYTIRLMLGDARDSLKHISEKVDAVLFDPFAPSKAPELWHADVFKTIHDIMRPGARLATYSCARWVRDNMRNVGFKVEDGPTIGRRSPGTIAIR